MPLVAGLNLIALPLEPATPYTSQTLPGEINAQAGTEVAKQIDNWNEAFSRWDSYVAGFPFGIYDIEMGRGYFIKCTAPTTWIIAGTQ